MENIDACEDSDLLHRDSSHMMIDNDNTCIDSVFFPSTNFIFLCLYDVDDKVHTILLYICR
jgi:hypothetical protein